MTRKRDLGPIFLGAGLTVALAAVVAGFLAIGGPGTNRAERLDADTRESLNFLAGYATCIFVATGEAPETLENLLDASNDPQLTAVHQYCDSNGYLYDQRINALEYSDDVEYEHIDASSIRLCANFILPLGAYEERRPPGYPWEIDQLSRPHNATGRHCFDIDLSQEARHIELAVGAVH